MNIRSSIFKKDLIISSLSNIFLIITSLFQGILISRILGPEGKGIFAFYMSLFSMIFCFTNFGVRQSTAYLISKKKFNAERFIPVHLFLIILFSGITVLFLYLFSYLQGEYNISFLKYFLFITPLQMYVTFTTSFALADKNINILNIVKVLTSFSLFFFLFLFYYFMKEQSYEYYFIAKTISYTFVSIFIFYWIFFVKKFSLKKEYFSTIIPFSFLAIKRGIPFSLSLLVYTLNFQIDVLILNNLLDISRVGIYSVGVTFAELIWNIPNILGMILFSYSLSAKNEESFSEKLWDKHNKILLILLPIMIIYAFSIFYLIPILFGQEFDSSKFVSLILLPGTFAIVSFNILNADLSARGKPQYGFYIFTFGLILNIVLNLNLIPKYDIFGAAISSTISYSVCSAIFIFFYKTLSIKSKK